MQYINRIAIDARLLELAEELNSSSDPEFDACYEDLEREFHDLGRLLAILQ
jgi:hypothetical protein